MIRLFKGTLVLLIVYLLSKESFSREVNVLNSFYNTEAEAILPLVLTQERYAWKFVNLYDFFFFFLRYFYIHKKYHHCKTYIFVWINRKKLLIKTIFLIYSKRFRQNIVSFIAYGIKQFLEQNQKKSRAGLKVAGNLSRLVAIYMLSKFKCVINLF